ncbi:MAG TPA: peptide deformylase [Dehalococcoidales bacterium]|nr:MAG: peptide deformylase [Chloroflexi bacterium RBG_16_60_22]HJX13824.1 peptide deformylase [Dehalococcoidales bacterium]
MAVLPIRTLPDPVLRKKAKRVSAVDRSIKKLVSDMRETLHADPGRVGLAAPQVGVSLRITVIGLPEEEDIILINPEIVRRKGERQVTEGCLSLPGYMGQINRSEAVTVKALGIDGKPVRLRAEGLLAQALEHEIDHMNGTIYIDHLDSLEDLRKVEPEEAVVEGPPEPS